MARGFRNHIWYKLLDDTGVPIPNANIFIYDYRNPTTEIVIYDENGSELIQPITTDANGVFEFYVKDNINADDTGGTGYVWDTQFIISWSQGVRSGIIQGDHLFGEFESVNVSGNLDRRNRAISDFLGWSFRTHVDFQVGDELRCGSLSSSSSSSSSNSSSSSESFCEIGYFETMHPSAGYWDNLDGVWCPDSPGFCDVDENKYSAGANGDWKITLYSVTDLGQPPLVKLIVNNDPGWSPSLEYIRLRDTANNVLAISGSPGGSFALSGGDGVDTNVILEPTYVGLSQLDRIETEGGGQKHYITSVQLYQDCVPFFSSSSSSLSSSSSTSESSSSESSSSESSSSSSFSSSSESSSSTSSSSYSAAFASYHNNTFWQPSPRTIFGSPNGTTWTGSAWQSWNITSDIWFVYLQVIGVWATGFRPVFMKVTMNVTGNPYERVSLLNTAATDINDFPNMIGNESDWNSGDSMALDFVGTGNLDIYELFVWGDTSEGTGNFQVTDIEFGT